MNDAKVKSFNSSLRPPSGSVELDRYLLAAANAVGVRSDAELARALDVSAATLGNWKRRGGVPADRVDSLVRALFSRIAGRADLPPAGKTARAAFLEFMRRGGSNPLGVQRFPLSAFADAMGGMLALAEFLAELRDVHPAMMDSEAAREIADQMEGASPEFRRMVGALHSEP